MSKSENAASDGLRNMVDRACDLLDETEDCLASFERRGGVGGADLATLAGWIDRVFTAVQTMARLEPEYSGRRASLMDQLDRLHRQTRTAIKSGDAAAIRPLIDAAQTGLRDLLSGRQDEELLPGDAVATTHENLNAAATALNDRNLIEDLAGITRADACAILSSRTKIFAVNLPSLRISRAE